MDNENTKQAEVIEAVKEYNSELLSSFFRVGAWIWADFQRELSQDEKDFLESLGFRWNEARELWQNACGVYKRRSSSDPRMKYGMSPLSVA